MHYQISIIYFYYLSSFYCKISSLTEILLSIHQERLQPYLAMFVQRKMKKQPRSSHVPKHITELLFGLSQWVKKSDTNPTKYNKRTITVQEIQWNIFACLVWYSLPCHNEAWQWQKIVMTAGTITVIQEPLPSGEQAVQLYTKIRESEEHFLLPYCWGLTQPLNTRQTLAYSSPPSVGQGRELRGKKIQD